MLFITISLAFLYGLVLFGDNDYFVFCFHRFLCTYYKFIPNSFYLVPKLSINFLYFKITSSNQDQWHLALQLSPQDLFSLSLWGFPPLLSSTESSFLGSSLFLSLYYTVLLRYFFHNLLRKEV